MSNSNVTVVLREKNGKRHGISTCVKASKEKAKKMVNEFAKQNKLDVECLKIKRQN